MTAAKCSHAAARYAVSQPSVPCEECRAFIDRDGSPMTADVARQRYPMYRTSIDEHETRWHHSRPRGRILGASEQERKSNRNFLITCAAVLAVIAVVVWIVAFSNKSSMTPAEERASINCPSFSARANGECGSVQADEQAKHKEEVESEAHEAESVLKKRRAEETANAVEGIGGG